MTGMFRMTKGVRVTLNEVKSLFMLEIGVLEEILHFDFISTSLNVNAQCRLSLRSSG
jgi:hypothetical protein